MMMMIYVGMVNESDVVLGMNLSWTFLIGNMPGYGLDDWG
jgi:hypothetical protein